MKYDTLQTQMDTGKKKATKGNLWVEIPLKKKKKYIYIYIYIYIYFIFHI